FFYRGFSYSRLTAVYFGVLAFAIPLHLRFLYRAALDLVFGQSQWLKRVLVGGDSPAASRILEELLHAKSDFLPIGFLTHDSGKLTLTFGSHRIAALGKIDEAEDVIARTTPDLVILADRELSEAMQQRIIELCVDRDLKWQVIPSVPGPPGETLDLSVVG